MKVEPWLTLLKHISECFGLLGFALGNLDHDTNMEIGIILPSKLIFHLFNFGLNLEFSLNLLCIVKRKIVRDYP